MNPAALGLVTSGSLSSCRRRTPAGRSNNQSSTTTASRPRFVVQELEQPASWNRPAANVQGRVDEHARFLVRRPVANVRKECTHGSCVAVTVCGRAVPSKCAIAGSLLAHHSVKGAAKFMYGESTR